MHFKIQLGFADDSQWRKERTQNGNPLNVEKALAHNSQSHSTENERDIEVEAQISMDRIQTAALQNEDATLYEKVVRSERSRIEALLGHSITEVSDDALVSESMLELKAKVLDLLREDNDGREKVRVPR